MSNPLTESALAIAVGPGTASTSMPAAAASFARKLPGSLMQGVPASVTERHVEIFFQHARDDGRSAVFLVMLMVRDAGRVDFKMIEQRAGHARILGGDAGRSP